MSSTLSPDAPGAAPPRVPLRPLLSKSRFLLGAQCHRLLWWTTREPDAAELERDDAPDVILRQGHLVGEEARRRFPDGVLVDLPHDQIEARLQRTQELIDAGVATIFEASFRYRGVFVAVDVLRSVGWAWEIIEVKSSTKVKDEHLLDVAVQRWVIRGAGLEVNRVALMHLSRACVHPELERLFELEDVTAAAAELAPQVAAEVRAQLSALGGDVPDVAPGDHCESPRACTFFERCHGAQREHHVTTLYRIGGHRARELEAQGYETLADIGGDVALSPIARRQVRAVRAHGLIVERGLAEALEAIQGPVAYLDFETVSFAVPRFDGTRPWDQIAAQASVRIVDGDTSEDRAFLADGSGDPRRALGAFLVDALASARTVVAWNASFEKQRLAEIVRTAPELRRRLERIARRIVDLLPIVRSHVYHPAFGGSFSLKSVAPALAPGLGYGDLDIGGGGDASAALYALYTDELDVSERAALRASLLVYCARDTEALAAVHSTLRVLARRRPGVVRGHAWIGAR